MKLELETIHAKYLRSLIEQALSAPLFSAPILLQVRRCLKSLSKETNAD